MAEETKYSATDVVKAVTKFFETVLDKVGRVIEVKKEGDGWGVSLEALEESDYMRRFGKGDLLGIYDVKVDKDLNITSYVRKALRERSELEEK